MRKDIKLFLVIISVSFFSCESLIVPRTDNSLTQSQLLDNMAYTEGLLMKAYYDLPDDYNFAIDITSDDAVTNDISSSYRSMATGNWKSTNNPISQWASAYKDIFYINQFLDVYEDVIWSTDKTMSAEYNALRNVLHKKRLKGEAYGMRAYYKWLLLQYHGGMSEDDRLLGFPIIDKYLAPGDEWALPRDTYADCVISIFNDIDTAIKYLPAKWVDLPTGGANPEVNSHINATSGERYTNRMNGNAALALKSRVALTAASPAFSASSGVTWEMAATIAGPLLKKLLPLYSNGGVFYLEKSNDEIIWNSYEIQKLTWEQNNFPPSLYGYGRTNPTQSLVDAFGMANSYPISDQVNSFYDQTKPYSLRDPRLGKYIVYNSSKLKTSTINTYVSAAQDGINVLLTSTRTGYYLKKFMNEAVVLKPGSTVKASHTYTLARATEVLLNYAEAANEAWGPDLDPNGYGFTAKTLIGLIRSRGGITSDPYLASLTDAAALRTLIQNERRIELCFEGFRFWDIRRWKNLSDMKAPVKAAYITNTSGVFSYDYKEIEPRQYDDYMIYGPIPYSETIKYNLGQNKGW